MTAVSSFADVLRQRAAEQPDKRAFTFLDNGETESDTLTYAELDRDATAIAATLGRQARAGDRALLLFPPGLDFVRAFMGCLYAGIVAVPAYPPRRNRSIDRLVAIAADAQPAVVLTNAVASKALARGDVAALNLPVLVVGTGADIPPSDAEPARLAASSLAFLQYTSGSTGTPKGVMVTHANLLHNSELIKVAFDHSAASVFVSWLPVFHDMGLVGKVLQPIYCGATSVLMEPAAFLQKPVRWLRAVSRYRGTTSGAPNSAFELCLRKVTPEDRASLDLRSWRFAFNGAEPVRAATVRAFQLMFESCGLQPGSVHPCYGMAESTLLISIGAAGTSPEFLDNADGRELVSSGRLWLEERVVVEDGEIWIQSPSIAAGYWQRPEETKEAFGAHTADGDGPFFRTGDLGFLHDGHLFVTGRRKDLIIIHGRNLYPQDVEHAAESAHDALAPGSSAAFSIAGADEDEQLAIVCEVAREKAARLDAAACDVVMRAVRQAIAEEHDVDPAAIVLVRPLTMPKTTSGKIQRSAARERFLGGTLDVVAEWRRPAASSGDVAPAADASYEAIRDWLIARISAQSGIAPARVDIRDPFSRYGLDSPRAVLMSGDLEDWLGRPLPATLVYDFPSIDSLARHLAREAGRVGSSRTAEADEPIAIVGIGCRFPRAGSPEEFWAVLRDGVDTIGPAAASRPHAAALGIGGFLETVDTFDAAFFGITAREAEVMDPQQRLLLEVAWEAIEDAGVTPASLAGSRTGVFVGISNGDYARLLAGLPSATDPYAATGNALSVAANRLSYHFDLRGPSWAVDTACSSSLVALHHACDSLRRGDSDLALCGGVNLILSPELTATFSRAGMMSASFRCRTFDAEADGYVRGEGAAIVVLKRLSEATRDGDSIWAVVRGTAVNQDGRSNGLTAPNGPAQQAVIRAALDAARLAPGAIDYVEAHGTGTRLGDPIEMNALMDVLAEGRSTPCWVGSVKTNIGHLEAAAGIAGVVKVALAMRHREIPPHLHFTQANPHIAFDGRSFAVPTSRLAWTGTAGQLRRAGVSSFGFGGTNAHAVIEEAPPLTDRPARAPIPAHRFERKRYWIDESGTRERPAPAHALLGHPLPALAHAPETHVWEASITLDALPYLRGHRVGGTAVLPPSAFVEMALASVLQIDREAGDREPAAERYRVTGVQLHMPVSLHAADPVTIQTVVDRQPDGAWRIRVYNRVSHAWTLSASASVSRVHLQQPVEA